MIGIRGMKKRMKDEGGRMKDRLAVFDILDDGHEDGNEFVRFRKQGLEAAVGKDGGFFEQFKPVFGFLQFL